MQCIQMQCIQKAGPEGDTDEDEMAVRNCAKWNLPACH